MNFQEDKMSRGINRANLSYQSQYQYESAQSHNYCIFISHKYEDLDAAKEIAEYIMDLEFDVYLDDNDSGLQKSKKYGTLSQNRNSVRILTDIEDSQLAASV